MGEKHKKITACECKEPGHCERHLCRKTPHFFKLCQTQEQYFALWEEARGPGQQRLSPEEKEHIISNAVARVKHEKPSFARKGLNVTKAMLRFVENGGKFVNKEVYQKRLSECDKCIFQHNNKCLHKSCGCYLTAKLKLKSEECPINRWSKDDG